MGKQGPCYHCGVTSTPLWRNGPPEKPVLCNACGSRWRTKGSLANYTPLHSRADFVDTSDVKISKPKSIPIKKEPKSNKRKNFDISFEGNGEASHTDENFKQLLEEEASTRSSSDSAVSYSESHAYLCNADGSDITGTSQSVVWETIVPSKMRTSVSRSKASSVEKLTKDLCSILQEQQQSVQFSLSSEEDLLFESGSPLDSFEIGHGGCLIKFINSNHREEESEASSISVYSKKHRLAYAQTGSQSLVSPKCREMSTTNVGIGLVKIENLNSESLSESANRNKPPDEKISVLNRNSPLESVDLTMIANYEQFLKHLNCGEQEQLMKFLPSPDISNPPDSLQNMFRSDEFLEALSSFQQLLSQGIFDVPCKGDDNTNYKTLRRLLLSNSKKSKWIEHYHENKVTKEKEGVLFDEQIKGAALVRSGSSFSLPRTLEDRNQNFIEPQPRSFNPNRNASIADNATPRVIGRNALTLLKDGMSSRIGSSQFSTGSSDQSLLLDIPSNAPIPDAELVSGQQWKIISASGTTQASNSGENSNKKPSFKKPGQCYSTPI